MRVARSPSSAQARECARLKVCLLGDREVGKTALAERFALRAPPKAYRATHEARGYRRQLGVALDRARYVLDLEVWDVPGDLRIFSLMDRPLLDGLDGAFLVGDASRPSTLETLPAWMERVHHRAPRTLLGLLVNKGDLPRKGRGPERVATAASAHGLPWIFTSAATTRNVDRAFVSMAVWVLQRHLSRRARPEASQLL